MTTQENPYFEALFNGSKDIILKLNPKGQIEKVNKSFLALTGWNESLVAERSFSELLHIEDQETFKKAFIEIKKDSLIETSLRISTAKGEYVKGTSIIHPIRKDKKLSRVIVTFRDQTKREQEQKENYLLANIIESSDIIIYSRNLEGNITTWNSAAEQIFEYTKEEIIGKHNSILLPKNNRRDMALAIENALEGRIIRSVEALHITKDKKEIPIGMKISPIMDTNNNILGVSITARDLRREINFREKEKFLMNVSHLLGSSLDYEKTLIALAKLLVPRFADSCAIHTVNSDGTIAQLALTYSENKKQIWVHKPQTSTKKKKHPEMNPIAVLKSGKPLIYSPLYTKNSLTKTEAERFHHLLKESNFKSVIVVPLISRKKVLGSITLGSVREDKQFTKEDFALAEELGMRAGQAIDNALLYSEIQKKLDERKQFITELSKSRNQLRIILENITDGISVLDTNNQLIFVNDAMAKSSGYASPSEMLENQKAWISQFELYDEKGEPFNFQNLPNRRAVLGEETPQSIIQFVNKKTGESKWALVKAQAVYDEDQSVQLIVTITHDITEIQEQEARKDEFISMASHELKTPLTSLSVYLHLLRSKIKYGNRDIIPFIDKIEGQTSKLTKLVTDLLDISKIQSGKLDYTMEKFDLSEMIDDIVDVLQGTTEKHRISAKTINPLFVIGDKSRISQVLTNLLSNAIKYSPNGGVITVETEKNRDFAIVRVKDNGIGIATEHQDKIFTRLYQVTTPKEKTFPGLGIGLYISHDIINRHGGKIWVDSRKGKGSRFSFSVPLYKNHFKKGFIHESI